MTVNEPQRLVSTLGKRILADDPTKGTDGNISVRADDGTVAISPSGMSYEEIEPEGVPILDINEERVVDDRKPSSEFRVHMDVPHQCEDVDAVIYNHSPYASTFASVDEPVGLSHCLIASTGDGIPVTNYGTYGTAEFANVAVETLGGDYNACLLEKRGVLTIGATAREAYEVALIVEYCARIHCQARSVDEPSLLPDEEIDTFLDRFADCGQTQSADRDGPDPAGDCVPTDRLSDSASYRSAVSKFDHETLHQGLTEGTGGNIGVRTDDLVAISPSGVPYDEIEPEDVSVVTPDDELAVGNRKPSSEVRMHTDILREYEDAGAVVHNHSPYASTFVSLGELVPVSHYLTAFAGNEIPAVGYETYGTQGLVDLALEALGDDYDARLSGGHGVVAVGGPVAEVYEVALMVGYCARVHYQAFNIDESPLLPDEEIDTLLDHFVDYGQGR